MLRKHGTHGPCRDLSSRFISGLDVKQLQFDSRVLSRGWQDGQSDVANSGRPKPDMGRLHLRQDIANAKVRAENFGDSDGLLTDGLGQCIAALLRFADVPVAQIDGVHREPGACSGCGTGSQIYRNDSPAHPIQSCQFLERNPVRNVLKHHRCTGPIIEGRWTSDLRQFFHHVPTMVVPKRRPGPIGSHGSSDSSDACHDHRLGARRRETRAQPWWGPWFIS